MNSPWNACVTPMPALSLMLMGSMKVLSSVVFFFRIRWAVVPAWHTAGNKKNVMMWQYNFSVLHHHLIYHFSSTVCQRTVNVLEFPVGRFLAVTQGESEGLGEGETVSIFGLDDDRFIFCHTDEGLGHCQFGDVVIHIQQPHRHDTLWRLLRVLFRGISEGMKTVHSFNTTLL